MKKVFIVLLCTITANLFMSCLTTANGYEKKSVGMIENATPENSVLVYGFSCEPDTIVYYVDEKSDWEAVISTGNRCYSLPPAHKGAKLVAKDASWVKTSSTQFVQYNTTYKLTNNEWNVNVPKDKPLYFMGCHSIQINNWGTWEGIRAFKENCGMRLVFGVPSTEEAWNKKIAGYEAKSLKKLLKQYKGTAWEPYILERLEELQK